MGVLFNVTTQHVSKGADKVVSDQLKINKEWAEGAKKGKSLTEKQELISKLMRELGVSSKSAGQAVRFFKKDMATAQKQAAGLALKLDLAEKETKQLAAAQRQAGKTSKGLAVTVTDLRGVYASLAGAAGIGSVVLATRASVDAAIKLESATNTLNVATSDRASALRFIRQESDRLGLSFESTVSQFGSLSAAAKGTALAGSGTREIFSAVSEAMSILGRSGADTEGALRAIEQIMSKGTVQAEELRGQLGERIPGAFQIMARGLGVTTIELNKMLDRGEVLASEALPALARELRNTFGTDSQKRIETTAAAIERLENTLFELRAESGKLILNLGGKGLLDILGDSVRVLRQASEGFNDAGGAANFLADAAELNAELFERLGVSGAADFAREYANEQRSLTKHISETNEELSRLFAQQERFKEPVDKSTKSVDLFTLAMEREISRLKEHNTMLKEAERLAKSLRTSQEILDDELAKAQKLYMASVLSLKDMTRALTNYSKASQDLRTKEFTEQRDRIQELRKQIEALKTLEEVDIRISVAADNDAIKRLNEDIALALKDIPAGVFGIPDAPPRPPKSMEDIVEGLDSVVVHLDAVADLFQTIGGDLGKLLAEVSSAAAGIIDSIASAGTGFARGGLMGNAAGFAGVAGAFAQVFGLVEGLIASRKEKKFGAPTEVSFSEGRFRGASARSEVAAFEESLRDLRKELGLMLVDMPRIAIRVRNDGEEVQLAVNDTIVGVFGTVEEAFAAGLRRALGSATLEGAGEVVTTALQRANLTSLDELTQVFPILQQMDDATAGLSVSLSAAVLAERQFRTHLDVMSDILRDAGVGFENIVAWRQREIEAQRRQIEVTGLGIVGVSDSTGKLREWLEQIEAFNIAQSEQPVRLDAVAEAFRDAGQSTSLFTDILNQTGSPINEVREAVGGLSGGISDLTGEGGIGGLTVGLEGLGETIGDLGPTSERVREEMEHQGEVLGEIADTLEQATEGIMSFEEAFVELVRQSGEAQALGSIYSDLLSFQEKFGIEVIANDKLRRDILELEFRASQARLILAVREIQLNQEALRLTEAQVAQFTELAGTIATLDPSAIRAPRTGGGSGGRRQAAQSFREEIERIQAELAGSTPETLAAADAFKNLTEQARTGKINVDELARGLHALAELNLREITESARGETLRTQRTDFASRFHEIGQAAADALAEAAANAIHNPEAFAETQRAIEENLGAQLNALGQEVLDSLGSPFRNLRQSFRDTARAIRFMQNNMDKLDLTVEKIANTVRGAVLPGFLDLIEAQAVRVKDEDAIAKIQQRRLQLEQVLARLEFENQVRLLELAGAVTPALQEMIEMGRRLFDTVTPLGDILDNVLPSGVRLRSGATSLPPVNVGTSGGGGAATTPGELLADILEDLRLRGMSPMERITFEFEALMERIADATGSAGDRALAAALAQEQYVQALADAQEQTLGSLRDLVQGARETLEGQLAPVLQIRAAREAFEAARAGLDINDESSVERLVRAGETYQRIATNLGLGAVPGTALEQIAALAELLPAVPGSVEAGTGTGATVPESFGLVPAGGFQTFAGGGTSQASAVESELEELRADVSLLRTDLARRHQEDRTWKRAIIAVADQLG